MNHYDYNLKIVLYKVINLYLLVKFEKDQTVFNTLESLSSRFVV